MLVYHSIVKTAIVNGSSMAAVTSDVNTLYNDMFMFIKVFLAYLMISLG